MDKKFLYKVLYYGSLWGIAEATLGHLLHAVPLFDIFKDFGLHHVSHWCGMYVPGVCEYRQG